MRSLEPRLRRLEKMLGVGAKKRIAGRSKAELDRQEAELRQEGFKGEVQRMLIQRIIVAPAPTDKDGRITGPPLPDYIVEYDEYGNPIGRTPYNPPD